MRVGGKNVPRKRSAKGQAQEQQSILLAAVKGGGLKVQRPLGLT